MGAGAGEGVGLRHKAESSGESSLPWAFMQVLPLSTVGDLGHCATLSAPDFITTCEGTERT